MKKETKNKLLATTGLPIAPGVFGASSAAPGGCPNIEAEQPEEPVQPAFQVIFYCGAAASDVKTRIASAYDDIWRDNPRLIQSLTFRGFKRLPIRVDYAGAGDKSSVEYNPSGSAIRIRGSVVGKDFSELLEDALAAYLHDNRTDRWEKIR
jgi:hypothetical protein